MMNNISKKNYLIATIGIFKNKKIYFYDNNILRPTKTIVKKIFYSYIKNISDLYILDLFAGSGILCFELFFMTAKKIILIEKDKYIYKTITYNKKKYITSNNFEIRLVDSYIWIKKMLLLNISLIIIDPPYNAIFIKDYFNLLENIIFTKKYLFIFFENNKILTLKNYLLNTFLIIKKKKGITTFYLIKKI